MVAALDPLVAAGRGRRDGRRSAVIAGACTMAHWRSCARTSGSTYDAVDTGLGGYHLAQLAIGVLGVLVITRRVLHRHDPLELHGGAHAGCRCCGPRRRLRGGDLRADAGLRRSSPSSRGQAMSPSTTSSTGSARRRGARGDRGRAVPDRVGRVGRARLLLRNTAGGIATFVGAAVRAARHRAMLPDSGSDSSALPAAATPARRSSHVRQPHHAAWGGFALFCGWALWRSSAPSSLKRRDA